MSVSLPVVSACKVQGIPVPTSVFSNHTGFPTHLKIDLTGQLKDYFAALNILSMNWDGIYCGYLGAKEQLHAISDYYDSLTEKPLFIIDPVMGDHGRAYQHITPEFCNHMKDFVSRGDIITPNLTEACLLTDTPYPEHDCTDSELSAISKNLMHWVRKNVLLPAVQKATLSLTIFPIAAEMWILFPRKKPVRGIPEPATSSSVLYLHLPYGASPYKNVPHRQLILLLPVFPIRSRFRMILCRVLFLNRFFLT